jgi:hypothetical protein
VNGARATGLAILGPRHFLFTHLNEIKKKNLTKAYSQYITQNTQVSQTILLNFYQIIFVRYVKNMFVKTKMLNIFNYFIGLSQIHI